jgi:hypothetical protein
MATNDGGLTRSIDQMTCAPTDAIVRLDLDPTLFEMQNPTDLPALPHLGAAVAGGFEEYPVEVRPGDVEALVASRTEAIGETDFGRRFVTVAHDELGAELAGAREVGDPVCEAERRQQILGPRQEALADVEAWESLRLEHHGLDPMTRQLAARRRPGRTAADHYHIALDQRRFILTTPSYPRSASGGDVRRPSVAASGLAWPTDDGKDLEDISAKAQSLKTGMWSKGTPTPPWDLRNATSTT